MRAVSPNGIQRLDLTARACYIYIRYNESRKTAERKRGSCGADKAKVDEIPSSFSTAICAEGILPLSLFYVRRAEREG